MQASKLTRSNLGTYRSSQEKQSVVKYSCSTSKKMFKLMPMVLIGMGLSTAFCSSALATDELYHGNFCVPNRNDIDKIDRSQWGVDNRSTTTTAVVQCPFNVPFVGNLKINSVWVTVYDRNPNTNVNCTLMIVGLDGKIAWSNTRSSSGSQVGHQFLGFQPPDNNFLGTLNMSCSIPPSTNAGISHVTTYRIIRTP